MMTTPSWQQPDFEKVSSTPHNVLPRKASHKIGAIIGLAALGAGVVGGVLIGSQTSNNTTTSPAVTTSYIPPQLPSGTTAPTPVMPTATIEYTSQKPTLSATKPSSSNIQQYPNVATLQGKVGYIKMTDETGLLWGKAVLSSDINYIDLSCQKSYPEADLVVMTKDNIIRKTYPTYGYPDAATKFCKGTEVSLGNVSGAYATLLSAALANGGVSRITSSPS